MDRYAELKKFSVEAYDFLTNFDAEKVADGHYELENGVFANVFSYTSVLRANATYEAHKKYIDVQVIIGGKELIAVTDLETMRKAECVKPYDEEKDIELYGASLNGVDYFLTGGDFLVLAPEDAHMPNICVGEPAPVRKIVVKVPADRLQK